jgi:hypothetical protein
MKFIELAKSKAPFNEKVLVKTESGDHFVARKVREETTVQGQKVTFELAEFADQFSSGAAEPTEILATNITHVARFTK